MSKKLFLQIREQEQLSQERQLPTEYLLTYTSLNKHMETKLVIGCNYHVKWARSKAMRFVLKEIKGDKARLITRRTHKDFWTDVKDLEFINTKYNIEKAKNLSQSN